MKIKHAKRSASQYESSISSQESCYDSIIKQIELSSIIASSSSHSHIKIARQCQTPPKNIFNLEKSYSLKKLDSDAVNQWREEKNQRINEEQNWHFESEDSKITNKQRIYSQLQKLNYKRHARILRFQQQINQENAEKQNEPIRFNKQQSSSDEQNEKILTHRKKQKRKVGKMLYVQTNQSKRFPSDLLQIIEQDHSNFL